MYKIYDDLNNKIYWTETRYTIMECVWVLFNFVFTVEYIFL